jgi:ABC-type xylose transport system permease subunit
MSFREKSAWITLITILVLTAALVAHLPRPWTLAPTPGGFMFQVLSIAVVVFVIIEIVAHIAIALWSPSDARAPKDERDELIALKATRLAAFIYVILTFVSVFLIHLGANQFGVGYCVLFSLVISEIVNYAARIIYYRRGV